MTKSFDWILSCSWLIFPQVQGDSFCESFLRIPRHHIGKFSHAAMVKYIKALGPIISLPGLKSIEMIRKAQLDLDQKRVNMLLKVGLLLSLAQASLGVVDVTTKLYGRTIYAMYKYSGFTNRWIGPFGESDPIYVEYDGYLRYVYEPSIYDPSNKVRLHVMDCSGGFACIRTRWRDDDSIPQTRYLQADWKDVDFEYSSSPTTDDQVRWQILCEDTTYKICYFGSVYYPDSAGYARRYNLGAGYMVTFRGNIQGDESLACSYVGAARIDVGLLRCGPTDEVDSCQVTDNPLSWYQFKLVVPDAASSGYRRHVQTSCNTGSNAILVDLSYSVGVYNNATTFFVTDSIADEVRTGFIAAVQDNEISDLSNWQKELNKQDNGFTKPVVKKVQVTVNPRKRIYMEQLVGSYGPYQVLSTEVILREESCSST